MRNPATLGIWGDKGTRVIASEAAWKEPVKWNRWALDGTCYRCSGKGSIRTAKTLLEGGEPVVVKVDEQCQTCAGQGNIGRYRARVFCASLADVFEDRRDLIDPRHRLMQLIGATPQLDWLLLTKRPQNVMVNVPWTWAEDWPPHVWLGVSVENRREKWRIEQLRKVPAAVRFLSCEPLLEDLGEVDLNGIHWVIAGGESGPNARAMHPQWARDLRDQCKAAGVRFLFKQWGNWWPCCEMTDADNDALYHPAPEKDPEATRRCRVRAEVLQLSGLFENYYHPGAMLMFQVDKKRAGRLLDGRTWDEVPNA